jgi:hypothetical protein
VKTYSKYNYRFIIGVLLVLFAMTACEKEGTLGIEVLPKDDLISVKLDTATYISSYTFNEELVKTDESSKSLLGTLSEGNFGITTIDFAAQFRLQFFPDYGENAAVDSIKLILRYRGVYGDTVTPQTFRIYELESGLDVDAEYTQDVDLKSLASEELLGEVYYTPKIVTDSLETTIYQQIVSIPLDISLGEKLINADSSQLVNNDAFLEYFKGLYIETVKSNTEGGSILQLDAISSDNYLGSGLVIYYKNDTLRKIIEEDESVVDSSFFMPFLVTENSARVNGIVHDYTGTPFEENLNSELVEDSLLYVQATGGLRSRILIDNLISWQDSVTVSDDGTDTIPYGINKAELIFQVDTTASDVHNYFPPTQLLFTVVDEEGEEGLPIDYVFSPDYYGGGLRPDYTYHFNITQHLQEIINGKSENFGFFLTPANKNNQANRVVLKGSRSTTGIKLVITYSKFNL